MITPSYGLTATERVLPRLALDFTTASLDPRVTFTRAGNTATVINSLGLVQDVNADVPRFDYDPTTLICKGLLIEESRQNLCLYSEDMANAYWSGVTTGVASAPVLTADAGVAPNGTATADQLVFNLNGGATSSDISQWESTNIAFTSNVTQSLTVWIKTTDNSTKVLNLVTPSGGGAYATATGEWTRVTTIHTPASTSSGRVRLRLRGSEPTSTTASILVWGWQVENGAFPTSYIPTEATAVTRNADVASMTGTNFSDWYNATEGALLAEAQTVDLGSFMRVLSLNNGTTAEEIYLSKNAGVARSFVVSGGSTQAAFTLDSWEGAKKLCLSYKQNDFASAFNGNAALTDSSGTVATVTQLSIGARYTGGSALNGHIQKIMYWSQRLTNNENQAFTK